MLVLVPTGEAFFCVVGSLVVRPDLVAGVEVVVEAEKENQWEAALICRLLPIGSADCVMMMMSLVVMMSPEEAGDNFHVVEVRLNLLSSDREVRP